MALLLRTVQRKNEHNSEGAGEDRQNKMMKHSTRWGTDTSHTTIDTYKQTWRGEQEERYVGDVR